MKKGFYTGIIASVGLAIGSIISLIPPSEASFNNTYYCAQLDGTWNTFVNTPRGKVKLIDWVQSFSEQWTPKSRCVEISSRFQKFLDAGNLKYIRTGKVNNLPVICVAQYRGGNCPSENVLITLEPATDPETVLTRLIDFRRSVSGQTISLTENDTGFYAEGEFYVDLNEFLTVVPTQKE